MQADPKCLPPQPWNKFRELIASMSPEALEDALAVVLDIDALVPG